MATGIANTPLINYFRYKQSTSISNNADGVCYAIIAITDAGNGQLLVSTNDTSLLDTGVAITIASTTDYNGDYSVISKTDTSFVISGIFVAPEAGGTWELASNSTGANAGDPLDYGVITFYSADDNITLQDTYEDRALTIPNPNPITLDAVGSWPPIYLQDSLYYITIYDKFHNLVATIEDYLPYSNGGGSTSSGEVENLLPNYGFDTKINDDIYDEETVPSSTDGHPLSAGWFWRIETTQDPASNTFSFNTVSASGLDGNPKNELVLTSTNNIGGCTTKEIYSVIGDYNAFQGEQLGLSIYTRLVNGSATDLTCELVRTRSGVLESPINIGTINISSTQTQQTLIFSVPLLTDSNYSNDDTLQLVISFPLNTDIQYGFTGTWLQFSADGTVGVDENASSVNAGKELFGKSFRQLQSPTQWQYRGLPLAIGEGSASVLNKTGSIFLGAREENDGDFNDSVSMVANGDTTDFGFELIAGQIVKQTRAERLIRYLRLNGITNSRYTFIVDIPNSDNVMNFSTGIGTAPFSTWDDSLSNGNVTINKTVDELQYALNVNAIGNGITRFTFTQQFSALTNAYNPTYNNNGGNLWGEAPTSSPIINWCGNFNFSSANAYSSSNNVYKVPSEGGDNGFQSYFNQLIINNGDIGQSAVVDFYFKGMDIDNFLLYGLYVPLLQSLGTTSSYPINYAYTSSISENIYRYKDSVKREWYQFTVGTTPSVTIHSLGGLYSGYFGYNDESNNPSTQSAQPPRLLGFDIDGEGYNGQTGQISTALVNLTSLDSASQVSANCVRDINTSFVYEITIVSVPSNGDAFTISNYGSQFIVIFYDSNQNKPTNPDNNYNPIYVEYTTSQSTAQIALAVQEAVNYAVMGVPKSSDLGFEFPSSIVKYYMVL